MISIAEKKQFSKISYLLTNNLKSRQEGIMTFRRKNYDIKVILRRVLPIISAL